jgi:hypothetical protein
VSRCVPVAICAASLLALGCTKGTQTCSANGPVPALIDVPTQLTAACSPYLASTIIEVHSTLSIQAGTTINFEPLGRIIGDAATARQSGIHVPGISGASVVAQGSATQPIIFQSADPAPAAGDWGGIVIENGGDTTSTFDYVTIQHAGGLNPETPAGIWLGGAAQITNSTFQNMNAVGVHVQDVPGAKPSRLVAFNNNNFAATVTPNPIQLSGRFVPDIGAKNNFGMNRILVESSSAYPSTGTWAKQDVDYEAISTIVVTGTLTIPPMVTVYMRPNLGIQVPASANLTVQQGTLTSTAPYA